MHWSCACSPAACAYHGHRMPCRLACCVCCRALIPLFIFVVALALLFILPLQYERFIRPAAMRFKKAHVTHPELGTTFHLDIIGVKKNPSSGLYTTLGVITKGTVIEVNVSELGLVTTAGKVVWGKYAQVTNNPELDGCINAVLLV